MNFIRWKDSAVNLDLVTDVIKMSGSKIIFYHNCTDDRGDQHNTTWFFPTKEERDSLFDSLEES